MWFKVCVAALSIATVFAEPPVNNGYLPPPTSAPGYNYPTPSPPLSPSPPPYRPPPPPPPRPSYRPPPQPSPPVYGPPQPPRPTYGTPAPPPPPPPPRPTYGTPAPPPPPPPRPSYGPPVQGGGSDYKPVQNFPPPINNNVNGPLQDVPSGPGGQDHDHGDHHHHEPGMPFDFNYAGADDYYGTDYSHNAVSDGDVVRGEYKVLLPDGRLQIVTYTADWKNGFNADIKYQGEPQYPAPGANQNRPGSGPSGQYQAPGQAGGSGPY